MCSKQNEIINNFHFIRTIFQKHKEKLAKIQDAPASTNVDLTALVDEIQVKNDEMAVAIEPSTSANMFKYGLNCFYFGIETVSYTFLI